MTCYPHGHVVNCIKRLWLLHQVFFLILTTITSINHQKNNNNMKNLFSIKNFATAVLALGFVFSFTSCEEDLCKDVTCGTNGTLTDNGTTCTCACATGYEGSDCETLVRSKFLGSWGAVEDCSQSAATTYSVTITSSPSGTDRILLSNFWGAFTSAVIATVDGDRLTIASQEPDGDGYFVNGTGTIVTTAGVSTITLTYNVEDRNQTPVVTDVCTGTTYVK
jgi:hypothetical protein